MAADHHPVVEPGQERADTDALICREDRDRLQAVWQYVGDPN